MMKANISIFLIMIISGTLISISASSWFIAWFGLEMNLMGLIPSILLDKNLQSSEATLKYFFVSVISSICLLFFSFHSPHLSSPSLMNITQNLISLPLLFKLGAAPLHSWLPIVSESLNSIWLFIMLTWQKLAPMALLNFCINEKTLIIFILSSAIVGSLGGLNQTSMKKIISYSSISHMSWLFSSLLLMNSLWLIYLALYSMNLLPISIIMKNNNINNLSNIQSLNFNNKIYLFIFILSLGGLPPFSGFIAKSMVIVLIMNLINPIILTMLITSAILNLYYYLKISYNFLFIHLMNMKFLNSNIMNMNFFLLLSPLFIWMMF